MTSTRHSTPSKRSLTARHRNVAITTPRKPEKKTKRQPVNDRRSFAAACKDRQRQRDTYVAKNRKGSTPLTRAVAVEAADDSQQYLYANNDMARMAFSDIAVRHLKRFLFGTRHRVFWVTLIPRNYVIPEREAAGFNIQRVVKWAQQELRGLDYIAIVEPAYYTALAGLLGSNQRAIAWHVHAIVWADEDRDMREIEEYVNARYDTLVPGFTAALAIEISAQVAVKKFFYMTKPPINRYCCWLKSDEFYNLETGEVRLISNTSWGHGKRALRPGEAVRLANILEGQTLDRMIFGSGTGKPLVKAIRTEALAPYKHELRRIAERRLLSRATPTVRSR